MHEIKFPAHTQVRMEAAKAVKAAKAAKPVAEVVEDTQVNQVPSPMQLERKPRDLPDHMDSLNSDGRRAILENSERVAIAYGNLENPLILVDKVNMAMLRHCEYHLPRASSITQPMSQNSQGSSYAQDS